MSDESTFTRRKILQSSVVAGSSALLFGAKLLAQEPKLAEVIRAMAPVTGVVLPDAWVGPATGLVGVILDISKPLRVLDLGEIEPATNFVAR